MLETILVIFTSMEPNVPPMLQEVPVSTYLVCEQMLLAIDDWEDIQVTARCEKRKLVKKEVS